MIGVEVGAAVLAGLIAFGRLVRIQEDSPQQHWIVHFPTLRLWPVHGST